MTPQEIQLNKILDNIQKEIDFKNKELAEIRTNRQANIDALAGDVRKERDALKIEVSALQNQKNSLTGEISRGLSANNSERVRLAEEAENLKTGWETLAAAQSTFDANHAKLVEDLQSLDNQRTELEKRFDLLEIDKQNILAETAAANDLTDKASNQHAEAAKTAGEAIDLLNQAKASIDTAKNKADEIIGQAQDILEDAKQTRENLKVAQANADKQIAEANALRDEYTKKLEESKSWVKENSDLSERLSIWEAQLQALDDRLQDDKAKLSDAEKAYSLKTKGEKDNGTA